jgi:hypothetical protein
MTTEAILRFGELLRPKEAAELLKVSQTQLGDFRRDGLLRPGIHYIVSTPRTIRYQKDALLHWFMHRNESGVHDNWILERSK